jgi:NitT/TauT family transport system substrate-binding protein
MVFTVEPHVRLQEWVAEELGFFTAEGLEYEFKADGFAGGSAGAVRSADSAPLAVRSGAFEDMAAGRSSDVSCACHWAVNAAASARHGKMYGKAYSVCPAGIYVAADSASPTRATLPASRSASATTPAATTPRCRRSKASSTASR